MLSWLLLLCCCYDYRGKQQVSEEEVIERYGGTHIPESLMIPGEKVNDSVLFNPPNPLSTQPTLNPTHPQPNPTQPQHTHNPPNPPLTYSQPTLNPPPNPLQTHPQNTLNPVPNPPSTHSQPTLNPPQNTPKHPNPRQTNRQTQYSDHITV